MPTNYEINLLLGTVYLAINDNMHAMIYLKQAFCISNRSVEVLQMLTSIFINLGDYTSAFCTLKRILPLVINNQQEYFGTLKVIKELNLTFDEQSYVGHKEWGDTYYNENNYHFALFEYENCALLSPKMEEELAQKIEKIKLFINPERKIISKNMELGNQLYKEGKNQEANKYYTKVIQFSEPDSTEHRLAKTRVGNV